jgi:hypothetical protein
VNNDEAGKKPGSARLERWKPFKTYSQVKNLSSRTGLQTNNSEE